MFWIPQGGASQGGAPQGGALQGGVPQGGVPQGGVPSGGDRYLDVPRKVVERTRGLRTAAAHDAGPYEGGGAPWRPRRGVCW